MIKAVKRLLEEVEDVIGMAGTHLVGQAEPKELANHHQGKFQVRRLKDVSGGKGSLQGQQRHTTGVIWMTL